MSCGQIRWTWQSTAPAVRILPLPAITSVPGPMTSAGSTPSIVSGLPALPMPTMRPSRTPTSALMMPQWSRMTAPVMTRSGVPSARVAVDWPIDSRMTLPPPNTASSPPAQRSSVTSIQQVGVGEADAVAGGRPVQRAVAVAGDRPSCRTVQRSGDRAAQAGDDAPADERHQRRPPWRCRARSAPTYRPGRRGACRGPPRGRTTGPGWPRRSGSANRPGSAGRRRSPRVSVSTGPPDVDLDRPAVAGDLPRDHRHSLT